MKFEDAKWWSPFQRINDLEQQLAAAEEGIKQLKARLAEAEVLLEQTIIYLCYDGSIKAGITQEKIEAFLGKGGEKE